MSSTLATTAQILVFALDAIRRDDPAGLQILWQACSEFLDELPSDVFGSYFFKATQTCNGVPRQTVGLVVDDTARHLLMLKGLDSFVAPYPMRDPVEMINVRELLCILARNTPVGTECAIWPIRNPDDSLELWSPQPARCVQAFGFSALPSVEQYKKTLCAAIERAVRANPELVRNRWPVRELVATVLGSDILAFVSDDDLLGAYRLCCLEALVADPMLEPRKLPSALDIKLDEHYLGLGAGAVSSQLSSLCLHG